MHRHGPVIAQCTDSVIFPTSVLQMVSCLFLCRKLHLFFGKSTKSVAIRAIFVSNMHQVVCRWGFALDPSGELNSALSGT